MDAKNFVQISPADLMKFKQKSPQETVLEKAFNIKIDISYLTKAFMDPKDVKRLGFQGDITVCDGLKLILIDYISELECDDLDENGLVNKIFPLIKKMICHTCTKDDTGYIDFSSGKKQWYWRLYFDSEKHLLLIITHDKTTRANIRGINGKAELYFRRVLCDYPDILDDLLKIVFKK